MSTQTYTTTQIMKHLGIGSFDAKIFIKRGIQPAEQKKNGFTWHAESIAEMADVIASVVTERAGFTIVIEDPVPRKLAAKKAPAKAVDHDPLNDDDDDEL